jgi:predicted DNA-binding ribbon-helix-helix protein
MAAATFLELLQQGQDRRKVSVMMGAKATSISLEPAFIEELKDIAHERGCSFAELVRQLAEYRLYLPNENLASICRLFVLSHLRQKASQP